jgi:hypothetical protein
MRLRILSAVTLLLMAAASLHAIRPKWARPYLKQPVPSASYIATDDTWVALYSEIELRVAASGGLHRIYRQVLAPIGRNPRKLYVSLVYNEDEQDLLAPRIWTPGGFNYIKMKLKKAALDIPVPGPYGIQRQLFITTHEIAPEDRAILTWEVIDKGPFPAEDVIFPFDSFPVAKLVIRAGEIQEAPLELYLIEPHAELPPQVEHEVMLTDLPTYDVVYDADDPWLAAPVSALPHVLVRKAAAEHSWRSIAAGAADLFEQSLAADTERAWESTVAELVEGEPDPSKQISTLISFVQSLHYREIFWGRQGYQPMQPSETLRTMSADCKGKVLLLQVLLAEIGTRSIPVLCSVGRRYQGRPVVPSSLAFNHVVLAVQLAAGEQLPGALQAGPGAGWVLVDPTSSLSTLGLPIPYLEAGHALWIDAAAGDLFTVQTREPASWPEHAVLQVDFNDHTETADFVLDVKGPCKALAVLTSKSVYSGDQDFLCQSLEEYLDHGALGLVVTEAQLQLADHAARQGPQLTVTGRFTRPLQSVGGGLFTFSHPAQLLRQVFGIPAKGYEREVRKASDETPAWIAEPCCQPYSSNMRGEIKISLPDSWSVIGSPELPPIDAPWVKAGVKNGDRWQLDIEIPQGRFDAQSTGRRIKDFNAIAAMLRTPFLMERDE